MRAPTPSAAAELLTPDLAEMRLGLARLRRHLADVFDDSLTTRSDLLAAQQRALRGLSPLVRVRNARQRIDDWQARMIAAQRGRLTLLRERVEARDAALVAASPDVILARGYAFVSDAATGKRIASASEARQHERIAVYFHDGAINAKVEDDR